MTWLNYKQIKASISFNQVLSRYEIELKKTGESHFSGTCPIPSHAGDRSNQNAFHVDIKKNVFNCFTHCGGGNIIDFVSKMEDCSFREAAELLNRWFIVEADSPDGDNDQLVKREKDDTPAENKPLGFKLQGLNPKHRLLLKDKKLSLETVKKFGVGFCTKGLLAGWIAIPIHNIKGELVAYAGRAVNDTQTEIDGKYKFPPGFQKMLEVYNLHRAVSEKGNVKKHGLIIVEGFFGVMKLWQNGYKNVVALMGKELSEYQAGTLLTVSDRFAVFLDGDQPGREASQRVAESLIANAFVRIVNYPEGPKRKPAHFDKEELKALL